MAQQGFQILPPVTATSASRNSICSARKQAMDTLETTTVEWKRHHNMLSAISRLPPEILSTVFVWVVGDIVWPYGYIRQLRLITHVCSHWRHISLEYPTLWTRIHSEYPQMAFEMLQRSKMAPLIVVLNINHGYSKLVSRTMEQMFRIRNLSLSQCGEYFNSAVEQKVIGCLGSGAAPVLETLRVYFSLAIPGKILPETLLGNPHRLRSLRLYNCGLRWNSPFLHKLTSLDIHITPPVPQVSTAELLSALANIPNLESLRLSAVMYPSRDTVDVVLPAGIAHLTRLTRLDLQERPENCASLLTSLVYPDTTNVSIIRRDPLSSSDNKLARSLLSKRIGPIRCLWITFSALQVWAEPTRSFEPPRGSPLLYVDESIRSIWEGLQLQDLESLHVEFPLNKIDWLRVFGHLKHLKYIHVSCGAQSFIQAMSSGITLNDAPGKGPRLKFKALRYLAIMYMEFAERCGSETYHKRWRRALIERCKRGMALRELWVSRCYYVDPHEITEVEKVIRTVQWDNDEDFSHDKEDPDEILPYYY